MTEEIHARVMRKTLREASKPIAVRGFWEYVKGVAQRLRSSDGFVEWGLVRSRVQEALEGAERDFPGISLEYQSRHRYERAPDALPPSDERTAGGAPLDPEEAALLAALRARGLNELAEMALHCFGDSYGHAPTALKEVAATSTVQLVAEAMRISAAWREKGGDIVEPRALRNFADSIDPHSEEYDPAHDPLRPVAPPSPRGFTQALEQVRHRRMAAILGCDAAALARLEELEPEAHREFGNRPLGVQVAGAHPMVTLEEVQQWYRARGLLVSMKVVGDQMVYDFVGLVEQPAVNAFVEPPPCETCKGEGRIDPGYGQWTEACSDCGGTGWRKAP